MPHRIKYLEAFLDYAARHAGVAFWHGAHILDWYRGAKRQPAAIVRPLDHATLVR